MNGSVRSKFVTLFVGLLAVIPAAARGQGMAAATSQNAAVTSERRLAVMYTFEENHGDSEMAPFGFSVDFGQRLKEYEREKKLEVVGQYVFGYFRNGNGAVSKISGGVRFGLGRRGRVYPFAEGLAGIWLGSGSSYFQTSLGGGFDFELSSLKNMLLRTEVTWVTFYDDPENGIRINVGLVMGFGPKK